MSRVVRFRRFGGPEVLTIEAADVPPPAADEIRIRVEALGLNRADALMRAGRYIETPALPSGLGLEAAGVVDRVGAHVTGFAAGEAVSVIPPISMARWPTYAELINVPVERVVKHPAALDSVQAAATWMAYLTAYGALVDLARLAAGEVVVVTAASSSVGLAAIQIANLVGATPIAVTRTSAKRAALLGAGAADVIASAEEDVASRVRALTAGRGARVVLDAVGGSLFDPLLRSLSQGGLLIEYGGLSPDPMPLPLPVVLGARLTVRGYLVHEVVEDPQRLRAAQAFILDGLATGALRPVVDRTFAFEEIVDAHRYLETNAQFGKIVVTV